MKIDEYARQYCSHLIRAISSRSLYEQIRERDDFPYDDIRVDETGELTKVVFVDDNDRVIDIYELISYTKEDIEATKDADLIQVWENYMSMLDSKDVTIADTLKLAREWRAARDKEDNNVGLLS